MEELPKKATLPSIPPPAAREEYTFSSGETTLRLSSVLWNKYSGPNVVFQKVASWSILIVGRLESNLWEFNNF